ncbi:hypothetical protein HK102_002975 [Quaeritorhiza haematococci]|nr:hypothetical protein HK102_002975 [Quaeritorhiza haematococci]
MTMKTVNVKGPGSDYLRARRSIQPSTLSQQNTPKLEMQDATQPTGTDGDGKSSHPSRELILETENQVQEVLRNLPTFMDDTHFLQALNALQQVDDRLIQQQRDLQQESETLRRNCAAKLPDIEYLEVRLRQIKDEIARGRKEMADMDQARATIYREIMEIAGLTAQRIGPVKAEVARAFTDHVLKKNQGVLQVSSINPTTSTLQSSASSPSLVPTSSSSSPVSSTKVSGSGSRNSPSSCIGGSSGDINAISSMSSPEHGGRRRSRRLQETAKGKEVAQEAYDDRLAQVGEGGREENKYCKRQKVDRDTRADEHTWERLKKEEEEREEKRDAEVPMKDVVERDTGNPLFTGITTHRWISGKWEYLWDMGPNENHKRVWTALEVEAAKEQDRVKAWIKKNVDEYWKHPERGDNITIQSVVLRALRLMKKASTPDDVRNYIQSHGPHATHEIMNTRSVRTALYCLTTFSPHVVEKVHVLGGPMRYLYRPQL